MEPGRSYADTKRAYRARARRAGKLPSKFDAVRFVGVDGEGFADGLSLRVEIGNPPHAYEGADHFYALLTDSDGHEIYNPGGRLDTFDCLDFLLHIRERDPNAVPVVFGGSYDFCHILAFGLSRGDVAELLGRDETGIGSEPILEVGNGQFDYRLSYRPRRSLTIRRWPKGAAKYAAHRITKGKNAGTDKWRMTAHESVTVWDVWGFFQGSFLNAMNTWLPGHPDWELVKKWKGNRKHFDRSEIAEIRRYNRIEVQLLVEMMDKLRDSIRASGLLVTRWDGVGAVASAFFKKNNVKDHMEETPLEVFDAARHAYSGGHIESMMVGFHDGPVYHYDISSAYPHHFRNMPSLAGGVWRKFGDNHLPGGEFTLVKVAFRFYPGMPFYPLFHRLSNGTIIYPERGCGWYWISEFRCGAAFAERYGAFEFRILQSYEFTPASDVRPFAFVEAAFERRKAVIAEVKRTGIPNGEQHTLKIGYNACYVKTAQQLGARIVRGEIIPPAYFQLEWAGAVTAGCRAQLMDAAMQEPESIIALATDGVYSLKPLVLNCPNEKILGTWEAQTHGGMTMVMPGVYWLHDEKIEHHSRGYDKEQMEDVSVIHDGWRQGLAQLPLRHERMVTLGNALMSDGFWKLRGVFVTTERTLRLDGDNSKREGIDIRRTRPSQRLVPTRPRDLPDDIAVDVEHLMSARFPISFMDIAENPANEAKPFYDPAFFLDNVESIWAPILA